MNSEIYRIQHDTFSASVEKRIDQPIPPGAIDRIAFAFEGWQIANQPRIFKSEIESKINNE